ncbi:hypothetical protein IZU87_14025 [Cobetia sp. MC34]|nr:hypothetical protein [Cobetia sp. MC34]
MRRLLSGLTGLCLMLLLSGCSAFESKPVVMPIEWQCTPEVPSYLLNPLPAPDRPVASNRDLLSLLADYESQRRRFNADRTAIASILERLADGPDGAEQTTAE